MKNLITKFHKAESGMVLSTELIAIASITLLAVVVGLESLANAVAFELNDIGNALTSIVQSYSFTGFQGSSGQQTSFYSGSVFQDTATTTTLTVVGGSSTIVNQSAGLQQNADLLEGVVEGLSTESVLSEEPVDDGVNAQSVDDNCNEDDQVNSLSTGDDCDRLRELVRQLCNEVSRSEPRSNSSSSINTNSVSPNGSTSSLGNDTVGELLSRDSN